MADLTTVYVSIGNSDDKLTQLLWSEFVEDVIQNVTEWAEQIYGVWYSEPSSPYQNACVAFSISNVVVPELRKALTTIREHYNQDSIAWAEAPTTEFI